MHTYFLPATTKPLTEHNTYIERVIFYFPPRSPKQSPLPRIISIFVRRYFPAKVKPLNKDNGDEVADTSYYITTTPIPEITRGGF